MFAKHIHKQLDLYQWSMIQDIYNIKNIYTVHWINDKRFGSSFYYFHCIKEQTMLICGKKSIPQNKLGKQTHEHRRGYNNKGKKIWYVFFNIT